MALRINKTISAIRGAILVKLIDFIHLDKADGCIAVSLTILLVILFFPNSVVSLIILVPFEVFCH